MAILVSKKPERRYQSIGSLGASHDDIKQAEKLNEFTEKRLSKLICDLTKQDLMPSEKGKGTVETYWVLGRALIDITNNEFFSNKTELPLLWRNIKMNLLPDERLLYRDRGPYREHLWYCFRLGSYPKKLAMKMNWGEWVTIFDSSGINQEPRFDVWFKAKLKIQRGRLQRTFVRKFAPCVNNLLKHIDVFSLNEKELFNCYEAAWDMGCIWDQKERSRPSRKIKLAVIQQNIRANFVRLDDVMGSDLSPEEFAKLIVR